MAFELRKARELDSEFYEAVEAQSIVDFGVECFVRSRAKLLVV
jgi:hypothetical protein